MALEKKETVIETFSLTKIFADWWGRSKVVAVDKLDLQIYRNEVFGLLGPNGSGKTTTIKMILSLLHPTSGRSLVLGGLSSDPKVNCRIGFLPEESYLYRYLTAYETLDFYGRLFGLNRKVRKERIDALLEMVGLSGAANRQVGTFSKGMARRIGLAQALINDPDLLILDEPTSGLDPIGTRQIKDLIIQLAKRGKTILLSSHLLADVEDVCDRISILYGGKIRSQGKVSELLQLPDRQQFTTGRLSEATISRIREILAAESQTLEMGIPVERLENFFIKIVKQAQKESRTSGAINMANIGQFLAGEEETNVLDELVGAKVEKKEAEQKTAVPKVEVEPVAAGADELLLRELAGADVLLEDDRPRTEHVQKPVEVETDVDSNILDELTGGAATERTGDEQERGNA